MGYSDLPLLILSFSLILLFGSAVFRNANGQEARLLLLERKINLILNHLGIKDDATADVVRDLIMRGQKIEAIRLYRQQSGVSLKEAKEAVDQMQASLRAGLN